MKNMFDSFTWNKMVFLLWNSLNSMLSELNSVAITTNLSDRRVVTKEVVFDLLNFLKTIILQIIFVTVMKTEGTALK